MQGKLWWIDVRAPLIQSWDPVSGEHQRFDIPGRSVGSWAFRQSGGMIVALHDGVYHFEPTTGSCKRLLALEADQEGHRLNDGRCDRRGRFWIGTMHDTVREFQGSFYCVQPDLSVQKLFGGIDIPNSVVFSPDDRLMYFADSTAKKIWVFDFDLAAGALSNRRVFVDCAADPGVPDGSAMDADGCLWNANYGNGRIVRYTPGGKVDRIVALPVTQPTCCSFGGPDLDTLYITTARQKLTAEQLAPQPLAGGVFALKTGVKGIAVPGFAG
ncbi:CBU_1789 family Dot/Icm type IV secretion system effector [Verticiella sediminum]